MQLTPWRGGALPLPVDAVTPGTDRSERRAALVARRRTTPEVAEASLQEVAAATPVAVVGAWVGEEQV